MEALQPLLEDQKAAPQARLECNPEQKPAQNPDFGENPA
jgi:hypothetical protein